jgi:ADP-dependent NAD(P)H-hydrate dehydratase
VRRCTCNFHKPLVLDADGLNAFPAPRLKELGAARAKQKNPAPLILTPHPGEMSRLLKIPIASVQKDREAAALNCQKMTHGGVVVLKGAQTVVTDGKRVYINTTGNSGMATGGTGDVLAGLLGALLGQRMSAFDAAVLGVYLHGLAGDIAAARTGTWSLIAGDLIDCLPAAFLRRSAESAKLPLAPEHLMNEIKKLNAD